MVGSYIKKNFDPYTKALEKKLVNDEVNFLSICTGSDELEMFEAESLQNLIQFKWEQFGRDFHLFGAAIHMFYICFLFVYTNIVYIQGIGPDETNIYAYILLLGTLYPTVYETVQMLQNGIQYYM